MGADLVAVATWVAALAGAILHAGGAFGRGFAGQRFAGHFDHHRGFGRRLGFEPGYYDYGCYSYPYYDPYSCYTPGY